MENRSYLRHTELLMKFSGLWPLKNENSTRSHLKIVADIVRVILGTCYVLFVITTALGFINTESEKEFKIDYVMHAIFYSLTCWRIAMTQTEGMKYFIRDIYQISGRIISEKNEEVTDIYNKSRKYSFGFFLYIFIVANGTWSLFLVVSVQDYRNQDLWDFFAQQNKTLPFKIVSWYPFDADNYHCAVYFAQCLSSTLSNVYNLSCESLYLSVISFATLRVKILKYKLKHLDKEPGETLKVLVKEHQDIIRYMDKLDVVMRWMFFGDVIGKSYHISITLFHIFDVFQIGGIQFVFALACSVFVISQMCCEYYTINDITLEALSIDSAIYESNWYEQEIETTRTLMIIMIRSQKPLEIHVGNLDTVSINTLVKALKAGYTYILLTL